MRLAFLWERKWTIVFHDICFLSCGGCSKALFLPYFPTLGASSSLMIIHEKNSGNFQWTTGALSGGVKNFPPKIGWLIFGWENFPFVFGEPSNLQVLWASVGHNVPHETFWEPGEFLFGGFLDRWDRFDDFFFGGGEGDVFLLLGGGRRWSQFKKTWRYFLFKKKMEDTKFLCGRNVGFGLQTVWKNGRKTTLSFNIVSPEKWQFVGRRSRHFSGVNSLLNFGGVLLIHVFFCFFGSLGFLVRWISSFKKNCWFPLGLPVEKSQFGWMRQIFCDAVD